MAKKEEGNGVKRYEKKPHWLSQKKEYSVWSGMKSRCLNKNTPCYKRYGGRGIKVCERWQSFENFYKDMGERPKGMTLDRIDNNGNYEPGNCKWATVAEQMRNMNKNRFVEFNGYRKTVAEWSRETGIKPMTIYRRLNVGISNEFLLSKKSLPSRQIRERKSDNRFLVLKGVKKTMSEWSRETGIKLGTIWMRLHVGWPIERVLAIDARKKECGRGHIFNEENTYLFKSAPGRGCRACAKMRAKNRRGSRECN